MTEPSPSPSDLGAGYSKTTCPHLEAHLIIVGQVGGKGCICWNSMKEAKKSRFFAMKSGHYLMEIGAEWDLAFGCWYWRLLMLEVG